MSMCMYYIVLGIILLALNPASMNPKPQKAAEVREGSRGSWESMTAFGSPVVPDVYLKAALPGTSRV